MCKCKMTYDILIHVRDDDVDGHTCVCTYVRTYVPCMHWMFFKGASECCFW